MVTEAGPARLAEQHAKQSERLLANRCGLINLFIRAQAHARLAAHHEGVAVARAGERS